jgi:hypothetical protein
MHADEIRKLLHEEPFRPFTIFLAGEKSFMIPHPDFALLTPKGRTLVVSHNDKEAVDLLDVSLIARIEVQEPSPGSPKNQ